MASQSPYASKTLQSTALGKRQTGLPRWLIGIGLGAFVVGGGFLVWRLLGAQPGPPGGGMPPGASVSVEPVQSGRVLDSSEFLGRLEAESGVALQPEVSGRITQIFVAQGDRVNPGQPIIRISPDRTQAEATVAQAGVSSAQAGVSGAQASVSAARSARDSAAATLRSLEAREAELTAELDLSEKDFERSVMLQAEGAISLQELDIASRDLEAATAALTAAQEDIGAARATAAQAAAALMEAEATLAQANAALNEAIATRAVAEENLQDRTVVAPITGTVSDVEVKLGNYVTPSSVITNIMENATLELDLEVPIEERDRLQLGLLIQLLASDGDEVLASGSITFIAPQTNADTQTVLIKAQFENPQGQLQDSQRVEARIVWDEQTGVLVPTAAVTRLGGQTFVYVVEDGTPEELPPPEAIPPGMTAPEQVARLRPVELGDIQDNQYHVLSGLETTETIVVSGILNLRDGTPILPQ